MRPHFSILGLEFCTLGHHVGDLGVHWDTKGDTLGSRVGFSLILTGFEDLVGLVFEQVGHFCSWLESTNLQHQV